VNKVAPLLLGFLAIVLLVASGHARAQQEVQTELAYQASLHQGPEALRMFLTDFPKGADLHVHLSGAVYAETLLREAGQDGLCVDPVALSIVRPPCSGSLLPAATLTGTRDAADQVLYDKLIDSISMRHYVQSADFGGHDQFFATFGKFAAVSSSHIGEWVDEVAARAAEQNQQYLELMETPAFGKAAQLARALSGLPELAAHDDSGFAALRQALLDHGLREEIVAGRDHVLAAEVDRKQREHCHSAQAIPACKVETRYIYQLLRGAEPQRVFAQALLGFETVAASMQAKDDTWVGINIVMPEDGFISMRDYTLHMRMFNYLHSIYPQVHISLHAGELAPGLVAPEGLRFHIRQAVELGHAERIGHGVDVMQEDDAPGLLRELADRHVMIEINLSSNAGILGVAGVRHPFPKYRAAHVPVALSTDDEGVSRIDITHEYVRAALDYGLSYRDLKELARTGMEHDFLPGASFWAKPDAYSRSVSACAGQSAGDKAPAAKCAAFLAASQKASAQWELERRFNAFEAKFAPP